MSFNLASPKFKANAYPIYAQLRAEAPVCRVALPDKRVAWLVTRYDDVLAALRDERLIRNVRKAMPPEQQKKQPWVPGIFRPLGHVMTHVDGADHQRLRALVQQAFTPRMVERMRARAEQVSNQLLDAAQPSGRMDLIREYAMPLPATIIAEILGVPAADRRAFQRWTKALISASESPLFALRALPPIVAFLRYIRKLVRERRSTPADDLVTALVRAEEAGDKLSEDELLAMIFLLLVAGYETTVNLIGNGTLALLQHPEQLAKLRAEPALAASAVEELLRYANPVGTTTDRYAREELSIADTVIPRGALVILALASANRDEGQFVNPDRLDITRAPNKHLSFGWGAHYCVGAPLARLEGQIAITTLLRRCPALRLAAAASLLRWRPGLEMNGLEALPVGI
ncbi:MAG TPA: cytochrome P450 [Roseiflexaceae bacterium]|nr:cytochrome P450 [Roseiflexaceae bacterium]